MINFIRIYLFFLGFLCFISYSEHLSLIYNNKNYGSLPNILFIAVQNSSVTLDRPQRITICASLLLKNSIETSYKIPCILRSFRRRMPLDPLNVATIPLKDGSFKVKFYPDPLSVPAVVFK